MQFNCNISNIDCLSQPLGIPWEPRKDIDFAYLAPFTGFLFDLTKYEVLIGPEKKKKYIREIEAWLEKDKHTLEDVRKLYGIRKITCYESLLVYACTCSYKQTR